MSTALEPVILTFGYGINGRNRQFDVQLDECVSGQNFNLDVSLKSLSRRPAFDLLATAPNGLPIRGFAQLIKRDGAISTLVQAGDAVYRWDTVASFTQVGTVSASSRLRGMLNQNWLLDQYTIITDLEKVTSVKKWDGTTFGEYNHNLGVALYAKYCRVVNERVVFANVKSGGADTPQVLLASALSDATVLTNGNRPSSSLSEADAFYIPTPDLRPINGLETGFGEFVISTFRGSLYHLAGSSAKDYFLNAFYEQASIAGDEAIVNIGNDVMMGLEGRLESLKGTFDFGDVETNDVSLAIAPFVRNTTSWTIVYDRRLQRVFCFPDDQAACWVLHKSLLKDQSAGSPWSKWATTHQMAMQPTAVTAMYSGAGEPMVVAGDNAGHLFRLDGSGGQDGGTDDVTVRRRSGLFRIPDKMIFDFTGWVTYTAQFATSITIRFLLAGKGSPDREFTVALPVGGVVSGVYNGNFYYGGSAYYGTQFSGRVARQDFAAPGLNNYAQIEIETTGEVDIDIQEIGFTLRAA